jgi:protein-S-isoprenylcysteine O-methyltransferase Ste14
MKSDALLDPRAKTAPHKIAATLPPSVTRGWIVAAGFITWAAALWSVRSFKFHDAILGTVLCMGALAVVNFGLDAWFLKIHQAQSAGLDWKLWRPAWHRATIKFAGLLASLGFIALLYWAFPEYHDPFYKDFMAFLRDYLPWWLALSIPYICLVDALQKDPHDGYYHAGLALTLQFDKVDGAILWQHCLGWLVKGFFIPIMFTYYVRDTRTFISYDFSTVHDFRTFYEFLYYFIFLADTAIGCAGYLLTLRFFDTHIRRAEPTFLGWMVALFCYQPFWSWFAGAYFNYSKDFAWGAWLQGHPVTYAIWGSIILALLGIYLWATVMFGCRFSNLTHRGIITNGPYRWTRHPAYIAKNISYWLIYVPFIVSQSPADSIRRCLLLGFINYIYYLRAKTEEANLAADPAYVQYSNWVKRHGIFRWLRKKQNR